MSERTVDFGDGQRFIVSGESEEAVDNAIEEFAASKEREIRRCQRWPGDYRQRMTVLSQLFPTMRGVPGTDPWNVDQLIQWMNSGAPTSGSWWAAMFLLGVWSPSQDWRECGLKVKKGHGRFNFFNAMSTWDDQHIQAMQEWIALPFWP